MAIYGTKAWWKKHRKPPELLLRKKRVSKPCVRCLMMFLPKKNKVVYCSSSCAKINHPVSEETRRKIALSNTGKTRKIPPFTEEHKRRISEGLKRSGHRPPLQKGAKCHFWKGGVAKKNDLIRHSLEYKQWREAVYKRDNYICVLCGYKGGNKLNADHIKRFSEYPTLRFNLDNGRTLCVDCHRGTENYGNTKKYVNDFATKTS